jgi:hypothetical protein
MKNPSPKHKNAQFAQPSITNTRNAVIHYLYITRSWMILLLQVFAILAIIVWENSKKCLFFRFNGLPFALFKANAPQGGYGRYYEPQFWIKRRCFSPEQRYFFPEQRCFAPEGRYFFPTAEKFCPGGAWSCSGWR